MGFVDGKLPIIEGSKRRAVKGGCSRDSWPSFADGRLIFIRFSTVAGSNPRLFSSNMKNISSRKRKKSAYLQPEIDLSADSVPIDDLL